MSFRNCSARLGDTHCCGAGDYDIIAGFKARSDFDAFTVVAACINKHFTVAFVIKSDKYIELSLLL